MANAPLSIEIDTSQIDRFIQRFPISGLRIAQRELTAALNDSLAFVENQVVDIAPVNTGIFRASIYSEITGSRVDIREIDVSGVVSSSDFMPKVMAIEFGRKPGRMPPIENIALWMKRRGLVGLFSIRTRKRTGNKAMRQKQDVAAAWGMAKHIAKYGTKAQHVFERGAKASEGFVIRRFDEASDNTVKGWVQT
jgi:hypothetical protein